MLFHANRSVLPFLPLESWGWIYSMWFGVGKKLLDWLCRILQLLALVQRLGLQNMPVPIVYPGGGLRMISIAPELTVSDEKAVANVMQLTSFLTGGSTEAISLTAITPSMVQEVCSPTIRSQWRMLSNSSIFIGSHQSQQKLAQSYLTMLLWAERSLCGSERVDRR